ncbi:MAG: VWA domain-containing protein [Bdellovibrionales bacterium]
MQADYDPTRSSVSYPGNYPTVDGDPLVLPNGQCLFIVNQTNDNLYVPLNSKFEWEKFAEAVSTNSLSGISIKYGCDRPPNPDGTYAECGDANGVSTITPPTSSTLCRTGTPTAVQSSSGACTWTWTCVGSTADNSTICQAPSVTASTSTLVSGPVQLAIVVDASSSMNNLVASAANAVNSLVPGYMTANPNLNISITVLGGSNYPTLTDNSCHYGTIYNSRTGGNLYGISGVHAGYKTPLAAAIGYAGNQLTPATARSVMLVLTDGADTCGGNVDAAVRAQESRGVKMFAIAYQNVSYRAQNFSSYEAVVTADSDQAIRTALNNALLLTNNASCPITVGSLP